MTPFLSRIATLQTQQAPIHFPAPVSENYTRAAVAKEPQPAKRVDLSKTIEDMGEWCNDVHDLPDVLTLEQ